MTWICGIPFPDSLTRAPRQIDVNCIQIDVNVTELLLRFNIYMEWARE